MFDPIFGPSGGRSGHPVHVPRFVQWFIHSIFTIGLALAVSAAVALPLLRLSLLPLLLFLLLLLLCCCFLGSFFLLLLQDVEPEVKVEQKASLVLFIVFLDLKRVS